MGALVASLVSGLMATFRRSINVVVFVVVQNVPPKPIAREFVTIYDIIPSVI